MDLEQAIKIFGFYDEKEITEEGIAKRFKKLAFEFHPDLYSMDDDVEKINFYKEKFQEINDAYEILQKHLGFLCLKNSMNAQEEERIKKQITKEQILMDIIVRAYYASKSDIDKINSEFLDMFLSLPSKVGHMTGGGYRKPIAGYKHIEEIFEEKSKAESEVMKGYVKKFALEFAEKYGIEINFLDVVGGDYINFLNNTNWFEKYMAYSEETKRLK